MKKYTMPVTGVMVVVISTVLLGFSMSSASVPSSTQQPVATVAPDVASEMNGDPDKVDMAGGIPMHRAAPGLEHLVGEGRGDGCLKGYGKPDQCLPLVSPAQQAMPDMNHPWTCADVRQLFPDGIIVAKGMDTLGLDPDGDGIAC